MAGPVFCSDVGIILRPLVHIADDQRNGGAGRAPFINAGQNLDLIRLLPLRREPAGAGPALVEKGLNDRFGHFQPRGTAIHHRPQSRPMGFPPGGETKEVTKAVMGHDMGVADSQTESISHDNITVTSE